VHQLSARWNRRARRARRRRARAGVGGRAGVIHTGISAQHRDDPSARACSSGASSRPSRPLRVARKISRGHSSLEARVPGPVNGPKVGRCKALSDKP
jgi:hypothetical protein